MNLSTFVFGTVPLMVNLYAKKYMEEDKTKTLQELEGDFGLPRIKTYDFIVVGGGTAGCVVAGRLSEKFNVLLLEAGGNPVPQSNTPWFSPEVAADPDTNFIYKSVPQQNMSLANGGIVTLRAGKMLGGSGSHNGFAYQRGSRHDWNNYARVTNDHSWLYQNVLDLFKKSENFIGHLIQSEQADLYGKGGPLTVDTFLPTILLKWLEAGQELGFPSADPNALQIESFAPFQTLIDNGHRVSTYNRYILPYEGTRANLTVIRYSTATQILLDKMNTAYGVAYLRHGIPQIAHASKEVIVSSGAINSPLLLMMSGIGSRDNLEKANIHLKVESPLVGQNLNDHIAITIRDVTFNSSALPYLPHIPDLEAALIRYIETGEGVFGERRGGSQAFFVSSRAKVDGEGNWPDGGIVIEAACPISFSTEGPFKACFRAEMGRPKSKGSVKLNSSVYLSGNMDFTQLAEIDFNGFSVPSDLDIILEGIELIFRVLDTEAFKSMGVKFAGQAIEDCNQHVFRSREYWACYVQQRASSSSHMVGTCGMGNHPQSVLDSKLKVRGANRFRVADASVLPVTPNTNINAAVVLVGEKAANLILQDWAPIPEKNGAHFNFVFGKGPVSKKTQRKTDILTNYNFSS